MKDTILTIDDSQTVRRLLRTSLRSLGYDVLEAEDGVHGLERLAEASVDLVVVALNLPNMDGLEFTRSLRADPVYRDMPIIMLTTEASDSDRKRGRDAGVNAYLVKPVAPTELSDRIRELLDGARD